MKDLNRMHKMRGRRGKTLRLLLSGLLSLALCLTLCACSGEEPPEPERTPKPSSAATGAVTAAPSPPPSPSPSPEEAEKPPRTGPEEALTIACEPFSGACDPFAAAAGSDLMLLRLTQTPLLCRAADGSFRETAEGVGAAGLRVVGRGDGSTVLRIAMRENVRFADGSYADADDLLFTLYALLDPDYDGGVTLSDCAIAGLKAYRTAVSPEILEEYEAVYAEAAAGEGPLAELAKLCLREAWGRSLRALTALCREQYLETYAAYALGVSPEEAAAQEGALRAFALWCAGLAEPADDAGSMLDRLGNSWNPAAGRFPEEGDLLGLFSEYYGSAAAFDEALGMETLRLAEESFLRRCGAAEADNVPPTQISGITRVDDYTVDLLLESFSDADLDRLGQLWLLPMHLYGEEGLFRPSEGSYGFPYGDLRGVRARSGEWQAGAGAFLAVPSGKGFHLEANLYYYLGSPRVGEVWFAEAPAEELLELVSGGGADLACLSGSQEVFELAREKPDLALRTVATDTWGILHLNRASEETEARGELETALLELAAVCCRASAGEYFGGAASTVGGEATEEEALEAFRAALEALPEGETASFTALVPGLGRGEHPCWEGLRHVRELLSELGAELTLRDFRDTGSYWAAVDAGEGTLWADAERLGSLPADEEPGEDCRRLYRRLDLLVLNSQRFELLSLPVELTWARDHISVVETLELK